MADPYVLRVAADNAEWLAQRHALIAGNVANANTPGFKARDLAPFSVSNTNGALALTTTQSGHLQTDGSIGPVRKSVETKSWEETLSGNSVNLEQQMATLGEVNRSYQLNVNIKHALHQMLSAVLK